MKTEEVQGLTRIRVTPLDICDGSIAIQRAVRQTFDKFGPRKALFDMASCLAGLAGAVGSKDGTFTIELADYDNENVQKIAISGSFVGSDLDQDCVDQVAAEPEDSEDARRMAAVAGLRMCLEMNSDND